MLKYPKVCRRWIFLYYLKVGPKHKPLELALKEMQSLERDYITHVGTVNDVTFRTMFGFNGRQWRDLYTYYDTGPRFTWSYVKDRPVLWPLTTNQGIILCKSYR